MKKELLDEIIEMEKTIISEQGDSMAKILSIDKEDRHMVFFCDMPEQIAKDFEKKQTYLRQVGAKIREVMDEHKRELFELVFVATAFLSKIDLKKEYKGEIAEIIEKIKKGEMRISDVPEKHRKELVKEGLCIVTSDLHSEQSMTVVTYSKDNGKTEFDEVRTEKAEKDETITDNILSAVWWGYINPEINTADVKVVAAERLTND